MEKATVNWRQKAALAIKILCQNNSTDRKDSCRKTSLKEKSTKLRGSTKNLVNEVTNIFS